MARPLKLSDVCDSLSLSFSFLFFYFSNLRREGVPFPLEDVHMRVRAVNPDQPRSLLPPTSAVVYWQVEIEDSLTSGGVIEWEQQIKLRHITTQVR